MCLYGAVLRACIPASYQYLGQTKFPEATILDNLTFACDCSWEEVAPKYQIAGSERVKPEIEDTTEGQHGFRRFCAVNHCGVLLLRLQTL